MRKGICTLGVTAALLLALQNPPLVRAEDDSSVAVPAAYEVGPFVLAPDERLQVTIVSQAKIGLEAACPNTVLEGTIMDYDGVSPGSNGVTVDIVEPTTEELFSPIAVEAGQAVKVIYRNETSNPKTIAVSIMLGAQQDSQITTLPRSCVPRVTAQTKNTFTLPGLGKLVLANRKAR